MKKILILLTLATISCTHKQQDGYYKGYELPTYKVDKIVDEFEFRTYQPSIVAESQGSGARQQAAKNGFMTLARYIFGKNKEEKKVSMTSPVVQIQDDEKNWRVQFTMPKQYEIKDLPTPNDDKIKFKTLPSRKFIAVKFSGLWKDETINLAQEKITKFAKDQNLQIVASPVIAYYDDPFTFPWNRRNEVLLEIK